MSCARPHIDDCKGKVFYRASEIDHSSEFIPNDTDDYLLPKDTLMNRQCEQEGLYPDLMYCNAYHKCTKNGVDEHYLCENQLLFNPDSNVCDYPINVGCGGKFLSK